MKSNPLPLAFSIFLVISLFVPRDAGAQITISPSAVDFGARGHGEAPTADVAILNKGTKPVRIVSMRASCSCTKVSPSRIPNAIAPGAKVSIKVTMSSFRILGNLSKYVEVKTDAGDVTRIPVSMSVFASYALRPMSLRLAGEVGGKPVTATTTLERRGGGAVQLAFEKALTGYGAKMSRTDHISWKVRPDGSKAEIAVTVLPTMPEGRFSGELHGRLEGKAFRLAFSGEMYRGLRPDSSYLNFNRVEPRKPESFVLQNSLTSIDGKAFTITSLSTNWQIEPMGAKFVVDSALRSDGSSHLIEARLEPRPGAVMAGRFSGELIVKTDHPDRPEFTFRVMGFFPKTR